MVGHLVRHLPVKNSREDQGNQEKRQGHDYVGPAKSDFVFRYFTVDVATYPKAADTLDYQLSGSGVKT